MIVNCTKNSFLSLEADSLKKRRTIIPQKSESELVKIFWAAPIEAFFGQETVAPVVDCSTKTLECNRWRGKGIPFRKVNGRVLYQKRDVINWLEGYALVNSTSEYVKEEKND